MIKKIAFILASLLFIWACLKHSNTEESHFTTPDFDNSALLKASEPASCAKCHATQHKEWQNSHHALALRPPHDTLFSKLPDTIRLKNYREYIIYKEANQFKLVTNDYFKPKEPLTIEYIIGVSPLIQYIVQTTNGKKQCLTFAYDTHKKEYFDLNYDTQAPIGDWLHWTGQSMNWNSNCADCHSTQVKKNYNTATHSYHTTYKHIQITCEACHGTVTKLPIDTLACTLDAENMVNVTQPSAQVNVCAPCHSRRLQLTDDKKIGDDFHNNYQLEPVSAQTFHADGQILDEVFEYHSYTQSKMYEKGIKCSNCHNMHTGKMLFAGNNVCTQCHSKDTFDTPKHHFHPILSKGAACVNCHMPGKYYMQRHFRHDHSIRVPRPDQSVKFGTPNACNNCHTDKKPEWAAKEIEKRHGKPNTHFSDALLSNKSEELLKWVSDTQKSAVIRNLALNKWLRVNEEYATKNILTTLMHDKSSYMRLLAMQKVENKSWIAQDLPTMANDNIKSVRIEAAKNMMFLQTNATNQPAYTELQSMYLFNEDNPSVAFEAANLHYINNRPHEALRLYKKAINLEDKMPHFYQNIAQLYNSLQQNDSAIHYLQKGMAKNPQSAELKFSAGLLYAETQNLDKAIQALASACALQPDSARYAYNLSVLYLQTGNISQALKYIQHAIKAEPYNERYKETFRYINQTKP